MLRFETTLPIELEAKKEGWYLQKEPLRPADIGKRNSQEKKVKFYFFFFSYVAGESAHAKYNSDDWRKYAFESSGRNSFYFWKNQPLFLAITWSESTFHRYSAKFPKFLTSLTSWAFFPENYSHFLFSEAIVIRPAGFPELYNLALVTYKLSMTTDTVSATRLLGIFFLGNL